MAKKKFKKSMSLSEAEKTIVKKYGEDSVYRLGDNRRLNVDSMPTGIFGLDKATGIGGLPRGRVVEIYGGESVGKSTVALHVASSVQKKNGTVCYIDVEHTFHPAYSERIGVRLNDLIMSQPSSGEEALDIVETLVMTKKVDLIIVDSVAQLAPLDELSGEIEKQNIGVQARMIGRCLRRITPRLGKSKSCLLFINQIREKVGVMYGDPLTTPGGRALKFAASMRIALKHGKKDETIGGQLIKGTISKNKVAAPFQSFHFYIDKNYRNSKGVVKWADKIDTAISLGILKKSRNGVLMYGTEKFRGAKIFRKKISSDKRLAKKFMKQLREGVCS